MKAHIVTPYDIHVMLCYSYPQDKLERLQRTAEEFEFHVRVLTDSDLCNTVGNLMAGRGSGSADYSPVNAGVEALIFSPLKEKQLYPLIDALSANKANTDYKAMMSPVNAEMELDDFITVIMEEHRQMHNAAQAAKKE